MRVKIMWAVHNIIAHPVMEISKWVGLSKFGTWLHDNTVPRG